MRIVALLLLVCCIAGRAQADVLDGWCGQTKLPSGIAICSDPLLRALTIERQEAFNQARARVGEGQFAVLMADQNAWVASYPKACGLSPDTPPITPLAQPLRDCMANAGRARITYLNSYGTSASAQTATPPTNASPAAGTIGPAFDCTKVTTPLARMICASPTLARIDLQFGQVYWALRQQLGPEEREELHEEDLDFLNTVLLACGVPEQGTVVRGSADCVAAKYTQQRAHWASRLTGAAAEEANRAPEQHLALQQALQALGFLSKDIPITGAYGQATRAAIVAWQTARGRATTGLIGDDDARALGGEIATPVTPAASAASLQNTSPPQSGARTPSPLVGQQDTIPMVLEHGTYWVPVLINGVLKLDFTVDSGAADVQITPDVLLTLVKTKTLSAPDFLGKRDYQLADGSTAPSDTFILHELRVGNHTVRNVRASVSKSVDGSLLLGQSFLSRFKSWTLDNSAHALVLTDAQ